MKDLQEIFTLFKGEFPGLHAQNEALGMEIHESGGLLKNQKLDHFENLVEGQTPPTI